MDNQQQNSAKIVDIFFGMEDYAKMKVLIDISNLYLNVMRNNLLIQKDPKKQAKYEKENLKFEGLIDKKVELYSRIQKGEQKVVNAYIIFRSMEGKERMVQAYTEKCCRCACIGGKRYREKLFFGKFLKVKESVAPDLILWENLKTGKCGMLGRKSIVLVMTLILLAGTFCLLIYGSFYQSEAKKNSPSITCPKSTITQNEAYIDQLRPLEDRIGLL